MHFLYLIQSKKDYSFYIGITNDLKRRFEEHNNRLSLATKNKTPWILVYYECYRSKKDALQREIMLKKHKGGWNSLKRRIKDSIIRQN